MSKWVGGASLIAARRALFDSLASLFITEANHAPHPCDSRMQKVSAFLPVRCDLFLSFSGGAQGVPKVQRPEKQSRQKIRRDCFCALRCGLCVYECAFCDSCLSAFVLVKTLALVFFTARAGAGLINMGNGRARLLKCEISAVLPCYNS